MVDRIWAWPEGTGYITARVFKFNVTDTDIRSLDQGEWLTDQVFDFNNTFKIMLALSACTGIYRYACV